MRFVSTHEKRSAFALIASVVLLSAAVASASGPFSGHLGRGDATLSGTGEYYEEHAFQADAGEMITVDMRSNEFDTYIILESPSGQTWDNDDWQGDTSHSRLQVVADAGGRWVVYATSYEAGETGNYNGMIDLSEGGAGEMFTGTLAASDDTLDGSGEYYDEYTVQVDAGDQVTVDMRSNDFDTYLILESPSGETFRNDDWQGDLTWSHISMVAEESGNWRIIATSYSRGLTGNYTVQFQTGDGGGGGVVGGGEPFSGRLDSSDATLEGSGEYYEEHTFRAEAGQTITIDMNSNAFDTYIILESPSGETWYNDDWQGDTSHSHLVATADDSGVYRLYATSYSRGETGNYTGQIQLSGNGGGGGGNGQAFTGRLNAGDPTLEDTGEFYEEHTFYAQAGQSITIDMNSDMFDTYLIVESPSGETWYNDDWQGDTSHSRVELTADQTGTWMVYATSYQAGETGNYTGQIEVGANGGSNGGGGGGGATAIGADGNFSGQLDDDDAILPDSGGKYFEEFTFQADDGERIVLDMYSNDFDTYLILESPSGETFRNDDWQGDTSHSHIAVTADRTGTWRVYATSFGARVTGNFTGQVQIMEAGEVETFHGALTDNDEVLLRRGGYYDEYTFQADAGEMLTIDMRSNDFDTYLIVESPSGEMWHNDDHGSTSLSRVELTADQSGTWHIYATSYSDGATGDYTIELTGDR